MQILEFHIRIMKIIEILKLDATRNNENQQNKKTKHHVRITNTMKIIESHMRIMKLMKLIEFHMRIMKIMKIQ